MEELIKEYIAAVAEETRLKEKLCDPDRKPEKDVYIYEALYNVRETIIDWALAIAKATAEQYTSDQSILNSELIRLGIRSAT